MSPQQQFLGTIPGPPEVQAIPGPPERTPSPAEPPALSPSEYPRDKGQKWDTQGGRLALGTIHRFYPIWREILEYWFPPDQGFDIRQDWQIPALEDGGFDARRKALYASLAVLYAGSPIILVQLHPPASSKPYERSPRSNASGPYLHSPEKMYKYGNMLFRRASLWSAHSSMCVISAAGLYWSGFLRFTDATYEDREELFDEENELEAGCGTIDDWVGEWDEKVTSPGSYLAFKELFAIVKGGLSI
ncbi:hypothetical protein CC2G_004794 [Coprinopsis cinerea AmutBmut pab1-1]|nr:hypothetical protein CC2G_004794 [Coprinopsis cinerea AmutBmut pab1-1]